MTRVHIQQTTCWSTYLISNLVLIDILGSIFHLGGKVTNINMSSEIDVKVKKLLNGVLMYPQRSGGLAIGCIGTFPDSLPARLFHLAIAHGQARWCYSFKYTFCPVAQ